MNKWTYLKGSQLENTTPIYMYECNNWKKTVLAAPSYTARKCIVSIANYNYCPHCGQPIVYNKRRVT